MFRKLLSLGVLTAAFTLVFGTTDAQARHCCNQRSHHSHHGCHQHNNCGIQQASYGCQQAVNVGCQQAVSVGCQPVAQVTTNACCRPRATCCGAQSACATQVIPASFSAPQPPMEQAAPAPAPAN